MRVGSINAHGRRRWHHPGLADLYGKRNGKKMVKKVPDLDTIPVNNRNEIAKAVKE